MSLAEFTLFHLLRNAAEQRPDAVAVVADGERCTHGDLLRRTALFAHALRKAGLRRGDRVGVYLEKSLDAVVSIFAVAQAGGCFVSMNPLLKEPQVAHIMRNCGMRMLVSDPAKLEGSALPEVETVFLTHSATALAWAKRSVSFEEALGSISSGSLETPAIETDLASIIYTSGSTGGPKGVMLSHRNLVAGAQIVSLYLENTFSDRVLSVLPFSSDYGLSQLTTMVRVGGTLVLPRSLLPGDMLKTLRQERITGLAGMPPVWTLLLQNRRSLERQPLSELRYITNSGGMIPQAHFEQLRSLLPSTKLYLMYGLTEAFRSTYLPPEHIDRGPACIGRAIPNTDIWVLNERGEECLPGEEGELVHRGPTVAPGFWGDEEKTRAVYKPNPLASPELPTLDRVVYSGDLVKRGEDGFLYFVGRRDEQIKSDGYRVSPHEVEDILSGLPPVAEAAVFGQKDGASGHKIVAVVALKSGFTCTPEEIKAGCLQRAPHYVVPKIVQILAELPRTPSGKIDRSALKHGVARG